LGGKRILAQDLRLSGVDAALCQRLANGRGLGAARNPDVDRVRILVLGGLDEGREIRVRYREADGTHDRAAVVLKALLEPSFGIDAWAVIRHHRVNRL